MNIEYQDARDATRIGNASNLSGVASTMERMVLNAVEINQEYIGDDVAQYWALGDIRALIQIASHSAGGLYPVPLRREVFVHTKAIYQMAYRIEKRNAVMAYPPLVIAAQALANITANASYAVGESRRGLVSHEELEAIDYGIPSPFSGEICGEYVYVNWYSDAMTACKAVVEAFDATEAAKTDEDRLRESMEAIAWLTENEMQGVRR